MFKNLLTVCCCALFAFCAVAAPGNGMDRRYAFLTEKFNMFNIIPPSIGNEEQAVKDIIEFYQRTGIDTVLYSMTLSPRSSAPYEKIDAMTASFRKIKKGLAGYPIKLGILVQAVLGHTSDPTVVIDGWTRTYTSKKKAARFCALNPNFAKYIRTIGASVAAEKPFFILSDDDIRSSNGGIECFCALHVAEYNRRFGGNFSSPEEYRAAVEKTSNTDPLYRNYEILRQEGVVNVCRLLREGINSVDPTIPGGTCGTGSESHFYINITREMAAKNQPMMHRMSNAHYVEEAPYTFTENVLKTQIYRKFFHFIPSVFDESDTFPHSPFSKSAVSFHAKLCSAIFNGLNGAKIWYVNSHKNGNWEVSRKYTDILAKYRNFYPALSQALKGSRDSGVFIPGFSSLHLYHSITRRTSIVPSSIDESWVWFMGMYGIPFYGETDLSRQGVYALRGAKTVSCLSDAQLKDLFKSKVLVDGEAAMELTKRGFAKYLGVEARVPNCFLKQEYYAGTGRYIYCRTWKDAPELVVKAPGARVLTEIYGTSYAMRKDRRCKLPGSVICKNSIGGTVLTTAFMSKEHFSLRSGMPRKEWLIKLLCELDRNAMQGTVLNDSPVMAVKRVLPDNGTLLMICNVGYDPQDSLDLLFDSVSRVERLNADGKWQKVSFKKDASGSVKLDIAIPCFGVEIIRVYGK